MAYIEIDARGCGAGKTTQNIIPRIKNNLKQGIRSLVVVPSIELQKEYGKKLPGATIINSSDNRDDRDTKNISDRFHASMSLGDQIVIITHQAFLNHIIIDPSEKINTDLIIDEAFDPFSLEILTLTDNQNKEYFKFTGVFSWDNPELSEITVKNKTEWFKLNINIGSNIPSLLSDSTQWRRISHPNKIIWATLNSGNQLMSGGRETVQLITEVNPDIVSGWSSVLIGAAAFQYSFMSKWLDKNKISYSIIPGCEFVQHKVNLKLHIPDEMIKWSKSLRDQEPEFLKIMIDYVEKHRTGRVVYVTNNDDNTRFANGDIINHNAHGINKYKDRTDYVHLSAIQPNGYLMSFYINQLGMDDFKYLISKADGRKYNPAVILAFSGYMTYQLIMRTHLRNQDQGDTWVNVFLPDSALGQVLYDYLFHSDIQVVDAIPFSDVYRDLVKKKTQVLELKPRKKPGRKPINKIPLTPAEKQKLYRERKKKTL